MLSFRSTIEASEKLKQFSGAFERLFGPVRRESEQKFSKNSNASWVAGGGMLKLRFDWYIKSAYKSLVSVA